MCKAKTIFNGVFFGFVAPIPKGRAHGKKNPSMMDFALHIHTYIKIHHFSVFFPSDGGKLSMKTPVKKNEKNPSVYIFRLHIHT